MMKLQRYRPGDAADMSLIEFVGRCVSWLVCLPGVGVLPPVNSLPSTVDCSV